MRTLSIQPNDHPLDTPFVFSENGTYTFGLQTVYRWRISDRSGAVDLYYSQSRQPEIQPEVWQDFFQKSTYSSRRMAQQLLTWTQSLGDKYVVENKT
jgi:hypothetical protein